MTVHFNRLVQHLKGFPEKKRTQEVPTFVGKREEAVKRTKVKLEDKKGRWK